MIQIAFQIALGLYFISSFWTLAGIHGSRKPLWALLGGASFLLPSLGFAFLTPRLLYRRVISAAGTTMGYDPSTIAGVYVGELAGIIAHFSIAALSLLIGGFSALLVRRWCLGSLESYVVQTERGEASRRFTAELPFLPFRSYCVPLAVLSVAAILLAVYWRFSLPPSLADIRNVATSWFVLLYLAYAFSVSQLSLLVFSRKQRHQKRQVMWSILAGLLTLGAHCAALGVGSYYSRLVWGAWWTWDSLTTAWIIALPMYVFAVVLSVSRLFRHRLGINGGLLYSVELLFIVCAVITTVGYGQIVRLLWGL